MMPILDSTFPHYVYCEQAAGFLQQPLNVLSCLFFWIAGIWMWRTKAEDDESPSFHQVSAVLLFLLGLFGAAHHMMADSSVAMALDMFLLFMLFIIISVVVSNDILRWGMSKGMGVVISLILVSALLKDETIGRLPQNGGLFLPLLFFLAISALKVQKVSEEVTVYLLSASYMLFFGLIARSIDSLSCSYFPSGFHFLWHILLAASIFYVGKTVISMKAVPWDGGDENSTHEGGGSLDEEGSEKERDIVYL